MAPTVCQAYHFMHEQSAEMCQTIVVFRSNDGRLVLLSMNCFSGRLAIVERREGRSWNLPSSASGTTVTVPSRKPKLD